jgi:GDP-mannose 6-dehydrogenase
VKIAIFGLGYVGVTTAACLAKLGHTIIGVDISEQKVNAINFGGGLIKEPGIDDLISTAREEGRLTAVLLPSLGMKEVEVAIVCVGTPSAPDGSHNMSYIAEVTRQIAASLESNHPDPLTVVYRSTIRPGSTEGIIKPIFDSARKPDTRAVELIYNPEFLREAQAINDFLNPPKIVIGTADGRPSARMEKLNEGITAQTFYVNFREAEITKFVDNSFHALKVSFANEIGRVCTGLGVRASKVHEIFISDTKLNISDYYTRPGGPFGGSCLPKDVRALQFIANEIGAETHVIDSLIKSNDAHKKFLFNYCTRELAPGAHILLYGLAFKANTDDLRESPNIDLARRLINAGFRVDIIDDTIHSQDLVGQNLGFAFSNLPSLDKLLISRDQAAENIYDVVIDTRGDAESLGLRTKELVNVGKLP